MLKTLVLHYQVHKDRISLVHPLSLSSLGISQIYQDLPRTLLSFRFPNYNYVLHFHIPYTSWFHHSQNIWWKIHIMKLHIMQFLHFLFLALSYVQILYMLLKCELSMLCISILMQHFYHFFLVLLILTGHISISSCRPHKKKFLQNYTITELAHCQSKLHMWISLVIINKLNST